MTSPGIAFQESLKDVDRLMSIHSDLTGTGPGRRHDVDVLNRSGILFACAAFEAFVETLAVDAFTAIVAQASEPGKLPKPMRQAIAKRMRDDPHELKIWDLAGDGWKVVCQQYKTEVLKKYVGPFNTPKAGNIDSLISELIGFPKLSSWWKWTGMTSVKAVSELASFVELRGTIAHGQKPAPKVSKAMVERHTAFLAKLSVRSANTVLLHCHELTGQHPWKPVKYGKIA